MPNMERLMLLKKLLPFPKERGHPIQFRVIRKASELVRRQKGARQNCRQQLYLGFLKERRGRVNNLGFLGSNNVSGLWPTGKVSSYLVPGPEVI